MTGARSSPRSSWLCPTEADRARLRGGGRQMFRARLLSQGALVPVAAGAALVYGWWVPLAFGSGALLRTVLDAAAQRRERPEHLAVLSTGVVALAALVVVVGTGGLRSGALPVLLLPLVVLAVRYRPAVVALGTALLAVVTAAALVLGRDVAAAAGPTPSWLVAVAWAGAATSIVVVLTGEMRSTTEAVVDPLTGMLSRAHLGAHLDVLVARARAQGAWLSVAVVDLDRFKRVNDEHGHATGDAVLVAVAVALRTAGRSFELTYRVGGEEVLVLLPGADPDAARALGERLRCAVAGAAGPVTVTASVGVASAPGGGAGSTELLAAADAELYRAKREGRDRVCSAVLDAAAAHAVPVRARR